MSTDPDGDARRHVDVLVAGAGPAGSVAALELARAGFSVLLADRLRPSAPRLGETLPGAGIRLLQMLGLASVARVDDDSGHCRVGGTLVAWASPAMLANDAIADPYGAGIRLDRGRFDRALRSASIEAGAGFRHADVAALVRTANSWMVSFDDHSSVSASWLVDATGRGRKLARLIGMRSRLRTYISD